MSAARIKAKGLKTKTEFLELVDEIARNQVALTKIKARRDGRIQTVEAEFKDEIEAKEQEIGDAVVLCEKFAEDNRDTLFTGPLKSGSSASANYGFRMGNPTLKLLNKRWNWNEVLKALKTQGLRDFIRTAEEPDKNALKLKLTDSQLAGVGLRIAQSEAFYIEPLAETAAPVGAGA